MANPIIFTIPYTTLDQYQYINFKEIDIKHLTSYSNKIRDKITMNNKIDQSSSKIYWNYILSENGGDFLNNWLKMGNKFTYESINMFVLSMLLLNESDIDILLKLANEWEINELKLIYINYHNRLKMIKNNDYKYDYTYIV